MPRTLAELFTWEWISAHWVGIIVFIIVAGLIIWKWSSAGKDSAEGPVAYAKKKHQVAFFFIGIFTLIVLVLVIAFGGPYLGKFLIWGFGQGITNTETVLLGDLDASTPAPTATANTQSQPALPTATLASQTLTNPSANLYTVSLADGATTRSPGANGTCDDNDDELGLIPLGTEVTITGTWPSYNIPGQRGLTSTGVCVHLSALTQK